ncbi:circadian clock protein KaiC [Thiorhodococcus mannitoliphagus]|uniref:non-specific serine/threonine protein kinase n=1 Tax=Thiorhodococcus mannitoliphagus TaxID=329406 RepID=A0A6P1DNZ5_9GAMM|nr:circadian clock protein KaiC [Thiorhodococcus mannitoliphagus]NEX19977.1 circadian clock protein KaiC [Thiorhodococcus mannitoliphagus]
MSRVRTPQVEKLPSGVPGLDIVTDGGVPRARTTLIAGTAGSGKTILAAQFLVEGVRQFDQHGVFITFEESAEDIRRNVASLDWDVAAFEAAGAWMFVDASPEPGEPVIETGGYDLGALIVRIEMAVKAVGATRVVLDSLGAIFNQFENVSIIRNELFRLTVALKQMGVTALMTAERDDEYGPIARHGVEEFVTDNVIVLRNVLEGEKRRRTAEVLKFRGTTHQKGEYPFTVMEGQGIVVIPLSAIKLRQRSSNVRISAGNAELDAMCGGGFFRDSIVLVSGATGCGKTLMTTEFISGGADRGERCLLLAFEESRHQLMRNASGWGRDYEAYEQGGLLKIIANYPESCGLEDHLIAIKQAIDDFRPNRVAVDSLSALERVSTVKGFREFVISLTSFIKDTEVAGLFTATTERLLGGESVTEAHISTITDSIILLRYVEMLGEMKRGLTVLKMRGSPHDKSIREFNIDGTGMHIGHAFRSVSGILAGHPQHIPQRELERMEELFKDVSPSD